jgi:hypothetical protein
MASEELIVDKEARMNNWGGAWPAVYANDPTTTTPRRWNPRTSQSTRCTHVFDHFAVFQFSHLPFLVLSSDKRRRTESRIPKFSNEQSEFTFVHSLKFWWPSQSSFNIQQMLLKCAIPDALLTIINFSYMCRCVTVKRRQLQRLTVCL